MPYRSRALKWRNQVIKKQTVEKLIKNKKMELRNYISVNVEC